MIRSAVRTMPTATQFGQIAAPAMPGGLEETNITGPSHPEMDFDLNGRSPGMAFPPSPGGHVRASRLRQAC